MALNEEQRLHLQSELRVRVSELPARGLRRHWRQLAEIHHIRLALNLSCEEFSKQLKAAGRGLSVVTLRRIEQGLDTHDGKPCAELQAELKAAQAKWTPKSEPEWMGLSDLMVLTGMSKSDLSAAYRSGRLAGLPPRQDVKGRGACVPREETVRWWSENGWWVTSESSSTTLHAQESTTHPLRSPPHLSANTGPGGKPRTGKPSRQHIRSTLLEGDERPLVTLEEAAKTLDTTVRQIRNMKSQRLLPANMVIKVPGLGLRVSVPVMRAWLESMAT